MHSGETLLVFKIPFLKSIIIDAQMALAKESKQDVSSEKCNSFFLYAFPQFDMKEIVTL
jgi:hypothetical protein